MSTFSRFTRLFNATNNNTNRQPNQDKPFSSKAANDNHDESGRHSRRLLKFADLKSRAKVPEMIKKLFTARSMIMLYGASGSLKSFLALDMAFALATGKKWAGLHEVEPGHVLYVLGEGAYGTYKRVSAYMIHHKLEEMPALINFDDTPIDLHNPEEVHLFIKDIKRLYKLEKAAPLQMIVFDTLARTATGADENSNRDMGQVVKAVNFIQRKLKCSVMLVHHTGKYSDVERGASCLRGAGDTMLFAQKTAKGKVSLTVSKQKDREEGQVYDFEAQKVVVDEEEGTDSLALNCIGLSTEEDTPPNNKLSMAEKDRIFITEALFAYPEGWDKAQAENAFVNHFLTTRVCSVQQIGEEKRKSHRSSALKAFRRAKDELIANETAVIAADGTLHLKKSDAA